MKTFTQIFLLLAAMMVFAGGCSVYFPQTASIPLMTQKNELHLNAGGDIYMGLSGSVAYSPVQNLALQVHGFNCLGVAFYGQGAIGTYLGKPDRVVGEVYGGVGMGGYVDEDEDITNSEYRSRYNIYYLQGNIGQTNIGSAHLDYGGSLKVGMLKGNIWDYDNSVWMQKKSERVLVEPQIFVRLGGERLKVGFQANIARAYGLEEEYISSVFVVPVNFGIQLNYRFLPVAK